MKLIYSYIRALHACIATRLYHLNTFILSCYSGAAHRCTHMFLVTGILPVAYFCFIAIAPAQPSGSAGTGAGSATEAREVRPLRVGDKVPEEFWTDSVSIYENGSIIRVNLSRYNGKPLLLDFWNTWCTTCIAHMPDLYETDAYKKGDMNVLLVTSDDPAKVQAFFADKEIAKKYPLTSIVGNNTLPKYFVHGSVPFYVLLNRDGMVQTMTGLSDLCMDNIEQLALETDAVRVSDVTTDIKAFPALLAQKYATVPNFHYFYFFRGENSGLGGGNIRREENGKIYSLSMLNIRIREMFRTIARYRYEELGIPFHHSFVQIRANLPILSEMSSLEYSVPLSDQTSVPLRTLKVLNEHLNLNVCFEQQPRLVRVVYDRHAPIVLSKINAAVLKSTRISSAVHKLYNDGIPVFDVSSATDNAPQKNLAGSNLTTTDLEQLGLGVQYVELEFPILII